MAYATLDELREDAGFRRVANQIEGDGTLQDTVLQRALDATSGWINTKAEIGGYPTPIVAANHTEDTELQDQITAMLVSCNIVLALGRLLQPINKTDQIREVLDDCQDWLESLAKGQGLPFALDPVGDLFRFVPADGAKVFTPASIECVRLQQSSEGTRFGTRFGTP